MKSNYAFNLEYFKIIHIRSDTQNISYDLMKQFCYVTTRFSISYKRFSLSRKSLQRSHTNDQIGINVLCLFLSKQLIYI